MRLDDRFRDRQPESRSVAAMAARRIDLVEAVEQARQVFGRDLLARVLDAQFDSTRCVAVDGDRHDAAARRVPDGVGQQIAQGATDHQVISAHPAGSVQDQADALLVGVRFIEREQRAHLGAQVHRLAARRHQPVLGLGQEQHVGDHAGQPLMFLQVGVQHFAILVGRPRLADRHLRLRHHVADRGAQLVRQIRRELGQAPEGILQAGQHFVEGRRQVDQLGGNRFELQALTEVAGRDALRHARDLVHRSEPAASCGPAQKGGQPDSADDRQGQALLQRRDESAVVLNVDRHRHRDRPLPGDPRAGCDGDAAVVAARMLPGRRTGVQWRIAGASGREQRRREHHPGRSEKHASIRPDDGDGQHVVADQRVRQGFTQRGQIGRRVRLGDAVPHEQQLAVENLQVQFLEVSVDLTADQEADQQQHGRRGDREEQREPQRDRPGAHHGICGSSSR